ncbi:AmmeMemoRadiSam system protein B [Azospirillum sp.]|uniref:AmmeMemoRadiSam system protein B n=1 Tax=Azospirillum sp. TaxID=34012 RepID=UPI002D5A664A|nr:AmmeMemoRadiSam system protein B [Azospirillum sp.]HYD64527.1 AmmeMemoRadiSam system protein B [Azospirillum sp.]
MSIREAQVAGHFYPAAPDVLAGQVDQALGTTARPPARRPKAIIAPHAGYGYSGPIAGTAYAALGDDVSDITRVLLLGPAHRHAFNGIAVPSVSALKTPLGLVPVDWDAISPLLTLPEIQVLDDAFRMEHSLEVQLPFLQRRLGAFKVVPLLVGGASADLVERMLERLWGGPETLIVISSDLSHYTPYGDARATDLETCRFVETLQAERLDGRRACGFRAMAGLIRRARALDLRATTLDYRNSGDTAGNRDRVVGYAAISFEDAASARLAEGERAALKWVAKAGIERGLATGACPPVDATTFPVALQAWRAAFVTVNLDGNLRGCIGSLVPHQPLAVDVAHNAFKAAFSDPRFPPLTAEEAGRIDIHVSILSTPRLMAFKDEADLVARLRPGVDGLILESAGRRGLFLPSVWEKLPDPAQFVRHLKAKAGLPPDHWAADLRVWRYTTESF